MAWSALLRVLLPVWALAGCASIQVPPSLAEGVAHDLPGQRLMAMLGGAGDRLDRFGQSSTVFVPDDPQWPGSQWACWTAHPEAAQAEAQRYVLALQWAPHGSSPAFLWVESQAHDRRRLTVPVEGPATVDGVAVTRVTHWVNGTLVHLAAPLPDWPGTPCPRDPTEPVPAHQALSD